ncbi:MAG TPA: FO synthase, partial [Desulfosporosinus sp.]|nr:FO synthase [Desulfosporosinus sp.]
MSSLFAQSELKDLIEKVERGERLDFNAGVRML